MILKESSKSHIKQNFIFNHNLYKIVTLIMGFTFAIVGLIFLFYANEILLFFNAISFTLGMEMSPINGINLYLVLAVGYMYLVSLLSFLMFSHPENIYFPFLLMNGKLGSSVLSFYFFIFHNQYLIFLANGIIDGLIGLMVLFFYLKIKKSVG